MFQQIIFVSLCTFIIHLSETLTYSLRLAGVRAGKLAVAISLSGVIVLISRTANMLQAPLTGTIVDTSRLTSDLDIVMQFRLIIASASVGTLTAILLFPSAVLLSKRIISHLEVAGSLPQLLISSVSLHKMKNARSHLRFPRLAMLSRLRIGGIPKRLVVLNIAVTAIYTIGVLAALLASTFVHESSTAASQSSGLINGVATILLTLFIDPQIGLLTDKVMKGEKQISALNKVFGLLMISRLLGTILAQFLLIPAAHWINVMVQLL
ncbi:lipid II flippase Amj family protein [Paenibacillus chartarius]|uniref:Lipid II flippase Amj n=1 Tax=Paenibacillus chartarius TaxID=747481 RepID=A0ABV6DNC4_9BACL